MTNPAGIVASTATSKSGLIFGFARSLWRYKFIVFTVIAIIFLVWDATLQSIDQKSIEPFVDSLGSTVFSADYSIKLYFETNDAPKTTWQSVKSLFEIISLVWVLGIVVWLFAFIISKSPLSNESMWFVNYALAVIIVYFIMTSYCLSHNELLDIDESTCYAVYPGVRTLLGVSPSYFGGVSEYLSQFLNKRVDTNITSFNQSINNSINITEVTT